MARAELTKRDPAELERAEERRRSRNKLLGWFPDEGESRRELYPKHVQFLEAGAAEHERLFIAANRVGKSETGAFELALHLTGQYPDWWKGRRFDRPVKVWAAGETGKKVREVVQEKFFGPLGAFGTGMLPGDSIISKNMKPGVPDAIDTVWVSHVSGGKSHLTLKSYEQGREGFDGDAIEVIWLDEEPSIAIYTECLLRTMTTKGLVLVTFTPLQGISDVVKAFLYPEEGEQKKFWVNATWDDAPHLDEGTKKKYWASIPPYQRKARSEGVPDIGAGIIYPLDVAEIRVDDFEIPAHWPRGYALDVGWKATAALWGALDRESDVTYLYSAYKRGEAEPSVHAEGIKARGEWIQGVADPAALGASQHDGRRLMDVYRNLGLKLQTADNSVEAGIHAVWQGLSSGKIKAFASLLPWFEELRLYRRNEKGRVVKEADHLMDCTRYLVMSGNLKTKPEKKRPRPRSRFSSDPHSWMWK